MVNNPYDILDESEILPDEQFEKELIGKVNPKVYIAPLRSALQAGKLDKLEIPPHCDAAILKWEWEIPEINSFLLNSSIKRLFCTSTGPKCPLPTFAYPDFVKPEIRDEPQKKGVFFMGWNNNKLRESIFTQYGNAFGVTLRDSYYYYGTQRNKEFEQQYVDGLAGASFCICPKGVGSGTRRFWEALAAGAVPILISDNFVLPKCWDWNKTIIRLSEKQALYTRNSIYNATIRPDIEQRREMCRAASAFFSNPNSVARYINDAIS